MALDAKHRVYTFHLTQDGLTAVDVTGGSLDEISHQLPDGTYTTLRTFDQNRFLCLDAHLDRLEDSACILSKPLELDRGRLRRAMADILAHTGFPESRLRITVPLNAQGSPDVYIAIESFESVDPELYETGVRAITMLVTRVSPRAKITEFIKPSRALKAGLPRDVHEILMVTGDGQILEGFTSNFFVFMEGRLTTADEGVLEGITRSIILALAEERFSVEWRLPRLMEIPQFEEAFITSSSRGVLPVVMINEQMVGDGKPGRLTRWLSRRYEEYVKREAKPL